MVMGTEVLAAGVDTVSQLPPVVLVVNDTVSDEGGAVKVICCVRAVVEP